MAIEEVGARLSLKDQAQFSRGLRNVGDDVDRMGRKARDAGSHFSSLGTLASGAGRGIGALGGLARSAALGVGVLTAAGVAAGVSLVNLASDAAEVESKFNTVFGPQGSAQVSTWITSVQSDVHIATDELQNAAATFGVFGQAIGVAPDQLAGFSTALAAAGLDLASFSNASPEDVFLALRSGLAGEAEPLRQFGIFLSDASLNAFAAAEGIGKTTAEMTEQEKVLLRQKFILANLGAAQGDLSRTADGVANQQRGLLGVFKDFRVELGESLLPVAQTLLPILSTGLGGALSGLRDNMPDLQRRTGEWAFDLERLFHTVRMGRVDTTGFDEQMEAVFGDNLGGFLNGAIDLTRTLTTNMRDLGTEAGLVATVEEMFGSGAAEVLQEVITAGQNMATLFEETLVPAWQSAQETLGPLAGVAFRAFADVLQLAADNAEELAPYAHALFVAYITSSAVNTVLSMAAALRSMAVALGLVSAASAGTTAAGAAGGAARTGIAARIFGGLGGAVAGVVGVGAASAYAGYELYQAAERAPWRDPEPLGDDVHPTPMPGTAPTPTPSGVTSPTPTASASGHDSWRSASRVAPTVTVSPTYNVGTSLSREEALRMFREHDRELVEAVQRGLEVVGSRQ